MTRRKRPNGTEWNCDGTKKANGTPKESKEFRGTLTEPPSSLPSAGKVPNYLTKLARALPSTPGLVRVIVEHDSWCAVFSGGVCNCDPIVTKLGNEDVH